MSEDTTSVEPVAEDAGALEPDVAAELVRLGTATLHEAAGQIGALPAALHQITPGLRMAGRAVTVNSPAGDNLWLHRAVYQAEPGSVLVVETSGGFESGYWGEILSVAAAARGIAGVVLDGGVRDSERLTQINVPIFARGLCIRGTTKIVHGPGAINEPVQLGDVVVGPGDVVVGDADGLVLLPYDSLGPVVEEAQRREIKEQAIIDSLRAGRTTLELYGFPDAPPRSA